jgi:hypothetical protein
MGSCFSRALLSKGPKANEELEFNKEEASLSQSSDNTAWPQSFRSPSKPLTVVNAPGTFHRKDSDIIRAAKENLRKFPSKSSLKRNYNPDIELVLSSSGRKNTASSSSARSGTGSSVSMSSEASSERNKSLLGFHSTRSSEGSSGATTDNRNNGSHKDSSHHSYSNGQDSSVSDLNHLAPSLQEEADEADEEERGEGSKGGKQNKKSRTTPPPPLNRNVSFCQEVILIQYYK